MCKCIDKFVNVFPRNSFQAYSYMQYLEKYHGQQSLRKITKECFMAYLLSPKSPSPGTIYALSFRPLSIQPVITLSEGYFEQKVLRPSGEDIYACDIQFEIPCFFMFKMHTKLMNIIRSCGTPCSISTSTAFMADPPVAR